MKRGLLVTAVALVLAADAQGETTISVGDGPGSRPYAEWVEDAKVPTPNVSVMVYESREGCDYWASSCVTGREIRLNMRDPYLRAVFYHELGHIFDSFELDDAARDQFRAITADTRPWYTPPNSPHEQFAEAYSMCARWAERPRRIKMWMYRWKPTRREHRQACAVIQRAGTADSAAH